MINMFLLQTWQYTPYATPLIIGVIVTVGLAIFAWRQRATQVHLTATFVLLMGAITIWSLGYALEISDGTLAGKIFWAKFQYLGIVATPVFWLIFALRYADQQVGWLNTRILVLLFFIPIVILLLVWTNEAHLLIWRTTTLAEFSIGSGLVVTYGPGFWVHWLVGNLYVIWGTVLLVRSVFRVKQLYFWQGAMLLLAAFAPWVGNALYVLRIGPVPNLDLTPLGFALTGLFTSWNFFRYRFLDIVPVARRVVMDNIHDAVIVFDMQQRVVDLNPAAAQLIGKSLAEVMGEPAAKVFGRWSHLVDHYQDKLDLQEELIIEQHGSQIYFDLRISSIRDQKGLLRGRVIVLRDITSYKEIEARLAQARDQALAASQLKSELLARVNHELRTPLGAVLGYSQLLKRGTFEPLSDQQLQAIDEIIGSTDRLTSIVNDLLDQAQIDIGRIDLRSEPFVVSDMIAQIESQMTLLAQQKNLEFSTTISNEVPDRIVGDRHRLQQILVNLVGNAVKFTKVGSVKVRVFCPAPRQWAIEVKDTGSGIPKEAQDYIFEPFRQVDGSLTREHEGAGLGLSIAKQLIDLMDGEIVLDSEAGNGSIFIVTLPLSAIEVTETEEVVKTP